MTKVILKILFFVTLVFTITTEASENFKNNNDLRSFDQLFGGAVSDGGGDRARPAVFVSFFAHEIFGIDSFAINYMNTIIAQANNGSHVNSYFQNVFGSFGQTNICVHFSDSEISGYTLANALIEQLAIQIVSDQAYYRLQEQRTKVYLNKDCEDISSANQQNLNNYIN